ncbi:MAG: META domain-containing protein [Chloroflexi bacterium]|nr:META domain-containing protein [Chloroflexota bacterium]
MRQSKFLFLATFALLTIGLAPAVGAAGAFANPAFERQWRQGEALAPNFWGPLANATEGITEPYREAPNGQRLVQYFDKGRMELAGGQVTNGLLATELTTGQMQLGDATFQFMAPPAIPIAGDPDNPGPTYDGLFRNAGSVFAPADRRIGASVQFAIAPDGTPQSLAPGAGAGPLAMAAFDDPTRHNVAQAFLDYRNRVGLLTIGYARTEPFQTTVRVAGQSRQVMVQVFERRILTYNPANDEAFRVEMGNIGQHYHQWRHGAAQSTLTTGIWAWQRTQMSDGAVIQPTDPSKYTLQFNADGSLAIQADCNRVVGQYTATSAGQLTITLGPTTTAACPPGSLDQRYLQQLGDVVTYVTRNGKLYLNIKFDSGNMEFAPMSAAPSLAGTMWSWTETQMSDGAVTTVARPADYTIQFNADGTAAIKADCNNVRATYTTGSNQELTLTLGPTTLIACPPDSQDQLFREQLGNVATYTMRDGDLYLALKFSSGIMHLVPVKPTSLTSTTWIANGINNGRGGVQSLVDGTEVTATFGADSTVTGSAGCNRFNGNYTVTGSAIKIGALATTRMACPEPVMTQEAAFLAAMQNATVYSITGDRLELRDNDGALQVGFAAKSTAAVTGTVTYVQRIALVSGSVVTVRLQDTSRADAPAVLIGEQVITTTGQQVPIPYAVTYDPKAIDQRLTYTVRATINDPSGRLIFTSTTAIPVITRGAPTSGVEIVVQPV